MSPIKHATDPHRRKKRHPRHLKMLGLARLSEERRAERSCVMLQIDGLSYKNFRRALQSGKLPFLSRLLRRRKAVAGPWHTMLPTSTAAFQTGLFYGDNDDIPGFFWFDKTGRREMRMNGADDTAKVEEGLRQRVAPFRGLLAGGSSYSALFTGGADNTFFTFARLFSPRYNLTLKRRWLMLFLMSQVLLVGRILYYSTIELALTLYDLIVGLLRGKNSAVEFKFVFPRIFSVVICREIATLAAILDIYRGVGPIYVNYFAYDEHAHLRGPDSRFAHWTLRGIDSSIRRIWKAAERARRERIRSYDVFVWSDHGQTPSVPFHDLFDDTPEHHFDMLFRALYGPSPQATAHTADHGSGRDRRRNHKRAMRQALENIDRQVHRADFLGELNPRLARLLARLSSPISELEAYVDKFFGAAPESVFRFVSTGPMAHICIVDCAEPLTYEDWQERFPYFLELIAQHKGVGFALTRTRTGGCMVGIDGRWLNLMDETALKEHVTLHLAQIMSSRREDLCRWANMKTAGDMLLFGQRDGDRPVITYTYEHGSHGGPSPDETLPFLLVPAPIAEEWPEISSKRVQQMLTLKDLHKRLRERYTPQRVLDVSQIVAVEPEEEAERFKKTG